MDETNADVLTEHIPGRSELEETVEASRLLA